MDDAQAHRRAPVLDRRARAFVAAHRCPAPGEDPDPAVARARMAALWNGAGPDGTAESAEPGGAGEPDECVEEEWLALPARRGQRIRVRILRPEGTADGDGPLPVVLYLHGLGWMLTDAYAHRRLVTDLVLGADAAVVVPEYDLPAGARHPAAVEQAYAVARWIVAHGAEHGLDGARTAVVGASAGAHQAAALTLLASGRAGPRFLCQVLVCPVTDAAMDTPSHREFADGYFLDRAAMRGYWGQYAPDPATRRLGTVSPLRAPEHQLRGTPPALVVTAEADVLRDEGEAYAARLREADVPVVSVRYHGTIHGFVLFDLLRDSEASRAARMQIMDTLHIALRPRGR